MSTQELDVAECRFLCPEVDCTTAACVWIGLEMDRLGNVPHAVDGVLPGLGAETSRFDGFVAALLDDHQEKLIGEAWNELRATHI